jgi:hypothetical protein
MLLRSLLITLYPSWIGGRGATREHGDRGINVIPKKEPYFPPPVQLTEHHEVEVVINSTSRSDEEVHATQNCLFHARALSESNTKKVVPQIEVGLNPDIGLRLGHKGCHVQDPRGSQVMQF